MNTAQLPQLSLESEFANCERTVNTAAEVLFNMHKIIYKKSINLVLIFKKIIRKTFLFN